MTDDEQKTLAPALLDLNAMHRRCAEAERQRDDARDVRDQALARVALLESQLAEARQGYDGVALLEMTQPDYATGEPVVEGTYEREAFIALHREGMWTAEVERVRALAIGESHDGGGGATPEWTVTRVAPEWRHVLAVTRTAVERETERKEERDAVIEAHVRTKP